MLELDVNRLAAGNIVALTGAGISAESGIPTFRGKEGYWTVDSHVYHPQEMATNAAFRTMPIDVWQWYLYRRTVCHRADPNPAHHALVDLEEGIGDRFRLLTQNVDGLHLRAGNTMARTYQIHGNIDYMRCGVDCTAELFPVPHTIAEVDKDTTLDHDTLDLLVCPRCGERSRPHVLWFDECYDETLYKFESSLRAATEADLLIVVGTSAGTNLPVQAVELAARNRATIIDINIEDNPFARVAQSLANGHVVRGSAASELPGIVAQLLA